ncbi:hypothetical protein GN543_004859 [Salmonella enterica]|nr:hypothetical protein [Salmonella enterica subsp. enterica serovar Florida]ECR4177536.1 hypothetical protein [Salmonella enterica]EDZ0945481.1 hypothetical protein [Salmonella enterica]EJH8886294.1 hypothetical protein [Salmonella enterica]EKP8944936.1 hypothetical protein [Salmonella enterica]
MANTNPLAAVNIRELVGFKQITPGDLGKYPALALNNCGINAVSGISGSSTAFSIGKMTVLGNTFYGLVGKTPTRQRVSYVDIPLQKDPNRLKQKAVQVGIRLTQSAVPASQRGEKIISIVNSLSIGSQPIAGTLVEDSSAYYEIVVSANSNNTLTAQAFVNKQSVFTATGPIRQGYPILLRVGIDNSGFTVLSDDGFTFMLDDIYIAELDYNSDGTVTPQLLGNLTLEPFSVASYTGDKHTNTKNQDIVTALNTLDPNNDMGVLAIKPVEQAAGVTFNAPDIAGKSIYGASLNIVYKDSVAPNNRLSYQITEGTTQLPAETITEHNADVAGFTTVSKILTVPANGGDWNAENLKFKLDMFNRGTDAE